MKTIIYKGQELVIEKAVVSTMYVVRNRSTGFSELVSREFIVWLLEQVR